MSDVNTPEIINLIEENPVVDNEPQVQNPEGGIQMDNTSKVDQEEVLLPLEISLPNSAATHAMVRYMQERMNLRPTVQGFTIFVDATEDEAEQIESRLAWVERSMQLQQGATKIAYTARDGIETVGKFVPVAAKTVAKTATTAAGIVGKSVVKSAAYGVKAVADDYARAKAEVLADESVQEAKGIVMGLFKKKKKKSQFTNIRVGE